MYGHVQTGKEPTTTSVGTESNVESGNNDNPQRNNIILHFWDIQ